MNANTLTKVAHGLEIIAHALREEAKLANPNLQGAKTETPASTGKPATETKKPAISMEVDVVDNGEEGYSVEELNEMTVKQLKELADGNGVSYPDKVRKSDLIELIVEGANEEDVSEAGATENSEGAEDETTETAEVDADSETLTIDEVVDMSLKELKELAKEYEIDHARNVKVDELMEIVINTLFDEDEIEAYNAEQEDGEPDEVDEQELTEEDLDAMNLAELKELADEHEVKYAKVVKPATLREKLRAELFAEDDESDETALDENDRAKELGLDEMTVEDLAELLVEHKLDAKGKKQALIARVLEAIDEGIIEVEEDEGK